MDAMEDYRDEIKRMRRIADMLCTAHSVEHERFHRRALILDAVTMLVSLYLVSMVFVDPVLNNKLTPRDWSPVIWTGVLAVVTFGLSVVQLIVNWKGRADAHGRSLGIYSEAKSNCIEVLNGTTAVSREEFNRVRARYDMAGDVGIRIPDRRFLKLKQKHLVKVEISKLLDERPALSFFKVRMGMWWRDNFSKKRDAGT